MLPLTEAQRARWLDSRDFHTAVETAGTTTNAGSPGCLLYLGVHEAPQIAEYFGEYAAGEIASQLASLVLHRTRSYDVAGYDPRHRRITVLLPDSISGDLRGRLEALAREVAGHQFHVGGQPIRLTPITGVVQIATGTTPEELSRQAEIAVAYSDTRLDLLPTHYESLPKAQQKAAAGRKGAWNLGGALGALPLQIALASVCPLAVPLAVYLMLAAAGVDLTPVLYLVVVAALLATALLVWAEGFYALRRVDPPEPATPYPPASAVIAAYLPNEVATVIDTVEAFLRLDYPAPLQVILAYNTPVHLPIEEDLRAIAARDPRFVPLPVELSSSKAQNINAALREVTGRFVGIFDADHHPDPSSFRRAWQWLSNGWDVVQGRCLVRNASVSWLSRTVGVEFESLYGVSHPGRARLHKFGIFGGSNGYWRTDMLHRIRMRAFMLTEDIDASVRALRGGAKIASDPLLISRELSPASLGGLWNQRMRWAQGWWQVSMRHLRPALASPHLSPRQKVGMFYLLGWSQIYPWVASQILPILIFWWVLYGFDSIHWLIPVFVLTSLVTLSSGPGKTIFAYRAADPAIKCHFWWFASYFFTEVLLYTPFKNLITRVAHVKQAMGETQWKVTPRPAGGDSAREHSA